MNWVKTAAKLAATNEVEQKYLLHESKYALLGAVLLIICLIPWTDSLIRNTFPIAKGPMVIVYKIALFIAIYYIIQKTDWFQSL